MNKLPKNAEKYFCESCDFKCSKLSNYNKHLATLKHINYTSGYNKDMIKELLDWRDRYKKVKLACNESERKLMVAKKLHYEN